MRTKFGIMSIVMFVVICMFTTAFAQNYEKDDPRYNQNCPCPVILKNNQVVLINQSGNIIKGYVSATDPANMKVETMGDTIYVLRRVGNSSYGVKVFDLKTGNNTISYSVTSQDIKNNRWMR